MSNEPVNAREKPAESTLHSDAERVRRKMCDETGLRSKKTSPIVLLIYAFVIFLTLAAAVFLLIAEQRRSRLSTELAAWLGAPDAGRQVFPLGPPETGPRATASAPAPRYPAVSDERVYEVTSEGLEETEPEREEAFTPPAKTEASERAFQLLQESSEVVAELVKGQYPGYAYQGWNFIQERPPIYYIQLELTRESDGQRIDATWSIHLENREARPLSQHARDLDPPRAGG